MFHKFGNSYREIGDSKNISIAMHLTYKFSADKSLAGNDLNAALRSRGPGEKGWMKECRAELAKCNQSEDRPFSHRERRRHGGRDRTICDRLCPCSTDREAMDAKYLLQRRHSVLTIVIEVRA